MVREAGPGLSFSGRGGVGCAAEVRACRGDGGRLGAAAAAAAERRGASTRLRGHRGGLRGLRQVGRGDQLFAYRGERAARARRASP